MLQKKLDYGFNGFQVPLIPKAARSARRRGGIRKTVEDNQMCAFDLLATVAGNLLLEGEISQSTIVEKDQAVNVKDVVMEEQRDEVNPLKVEHCHQASAEISSLNLGIGLQAQALQCGAKGVAVPQHDDALNLASGITLSDYLGKDDAKHNIDLMYDDKDEFCHLPAKSEQCSAVLKESCMPNLHECVKQLGNQEELLPLNGNVIKGSEDVKFFDRKPPQAIGLDSSFKPFLSMNRYACGSLSPSRGDNVKVVARDDDENSSGCTHPRIMKPNRWPSHIGGRKIRKLLASKYRRAAPKVKNRDLSDMELRYSYWSGKTGYKRQRSQRIYPFKKRRSFYYSSLPNGDVNISYKGIYAPKKAIDSARFGAVEHGVNGSSSSVSGQSASFPSRESHVQVRIKSFRVPELFIDMPETATIASLKRTVMEALTTLFAGGLHVGVVFQGKQIRDDNRTLLQSGIGRNDKVDSLGFTLEANAVHASPPISSEDNSLVLSSDVSKPLSRCPDVVTIHQGTSHPSSDHPLNSVSHFIESDHDSTPSPAEISAEKGTVDSQALVALPGETPQTLAMGPAHQKSKRIEMAQRRIRRPFSVAEVEALVQAVEELGTGRWRDVKVQAFDNVKHRTYVDLKDKWKTLVHTARISPQQRRGEPVPQELLDRVLAAHAYWSQQQAKQQLKQQPEACLLL